MFLIKIIWISKNKQKVNFLKETTRYYFNSNKWQLFIYVNLLHVENNKLGMLYILYQNFVDC